MRNRFLIALALLVAVSCQRDDMQDPASGDGFIDDGEMRFSTAVIETRAGMTTADLTDFGIYVKYGNDFVSENVKASYDQSTGWSTATAMTYPTWNNPVIITAYSPYSESDPTTFSVQSDQSTEAGVKASDLLLARSVVTPSATPDTDNDIYYTQSTGVTTVQFQHTMAKFTFNLTLGTEWASATENPVSKVTISGTKASGTISFAGGTITANSGTEADITALCLSYEVGETSSLSYEALLIPQDVSSLIVTVTMNDGMTIPYTIGAATLTSNENHTFALEVGNVPLVDYITFQRNTSSTANMTHDQDEGVITSILSKFRRCLMTSDGAGNATICYLQDDNSNYYADGSDAVLTGAEGDVMVYFPEYWYKYENVDDDYFRYYFSEVEINGSIHVPASLVGAYKGSTEDNKLYSLSDKEPRGSASYTSFISYASSRGIGYQIIDYNQHCVIAQMFYAKYLNRNSQEVLGMGGSSFSATTGSTNSIGNADTHNSSSDYVNGLGIEGVYNGKFELVQGVTINNYVWTITNTDGSYRTVNGATSSGVITSIAAENNTDGAYFDMVPTAVGGSDDTYYTDYYASSSASGDLYMFRAYSDNYPWGGVAYVSSTEVVYMSNKGTRLAFRGTITEAASVEAYKAKLND